MKEIAVDVATGLTEKRAFKGNALTEKQALVRDALTQANEVKAERNRLLSESDWTMLADAPVTDLGRVAWRAYRQALRDLPQQPGFPRIDWPKAPT